MRGHEVTILAWCAKHPALVGFAIGAWLLTGCASPQERGYRDMQRLLACAQDKECRQKPAPRSALYIIGVSAAVQEHQLKKSLDELKQAVERMRIEGNEIEKASKRVSEMSLQELEEWADDVIRDHKESAK